MRILSRVCADFYDGNHNLIHRITRRDLGLYYDVPDAIRQDPLYQMLVDDGSILLAETSEKQKAFENDPYAGATADGRSTEAATVKAKSARTKSAAKTETAADPKSEPKPEEKPADKPAETKKPSP